MLYLDLFYAFYIILISFPSNRGSLASRGHSYVPFQVHATLSKDETTATRGPPELPQYKAFRSSARFGPWGEGRKIRTWYPEREKQLKICSPTFEWPVVDGNTASLDGA